MKQLMIYFRIFMNIRFYSNEKRRDA